VSEGDHVLIVFLKQQGEVVRHLGKKVVLSPEGSVQLKREQLGVNVRQLVMSQTEAGYLEVVHLRQMKRVPSVLAQIVSREVKDYCLWRHPWE